MYEQNWASLNLIPSYYPNRSLRSQTEDLYFQEFSKVEWDADSSVRRPSTTKPAPSLDFEDRHWLYFKVGIKT